jgi:hypothetical protein
MEHKGTPPCSQEATTGSYLKQDESSPCPPNLYLQQLF